MTRPHIQPGSGDAPFLVFLAALVAAPAVAALWFGSAWYLLGYIVVALIVGL